MARIHARTRGSSSSKKPYRIGRPEWVEAEKDEIVKLIIDYYNQGLSTSEIGVRLRDLHGVPDVKTALGTSMYRILKENKIEMDLPEDIVNLMKRAVRLHRHLEENPGDKSNKRALMLTESKIRRLGRYYVRKRVLPQGWAYTPKMAKLAVAE